MADPSPYTGSCFYDAGVNSKGQHGTCKLDAGHPGDHQIDWTWRHLVDNPYLEPWESMT